MAWQYKREERQFAIIPEGEYRIRVKEADKAVSKKGNDMIALQFEVSGMNQILYHYITFLDDHPEITNRMLTQFFDSFKDIPDGDFNMKNWIGKVGACKVKHEEYNGDMSAKLHYFISAEKAKNLPAWKEPEASRAYPYDKGGLPETEADENGFMKIPEGAMDQLPLF